MANLKTLQFKAHLLAREKGWWDVPRSFGDLIALCHSELSEALEEYRHGNAPEKVYYDDDGKPMGVASELADVVIRIMDIAEYYRIDLQSAIEEKHNFNKGRKHRHEGKVL